jgi:catechol 2,3-dioxygenase-like lactoylglutathione lyase family enzyme
MRKAPTSAISADSTRAEFGGAPPTANGVLPSWQPRMIEVRGTAEVLDSGGKAWGENFEDTIVRIHAHHLVRHRLRQPGDERPAGSPGRSRRVAGYRCQDRGMEILSSRILIRPVDLDRSRRFYRDVLGLAIYREFGPSADPGVVFFLGQGFLEVSGHAPGPAADAVMIWLQVRDVHAEHDRLAAAGARILREPVAEPWGLTEMWIADPDGIPIVVVEVPADHPLRRDPR